jgi:histidinol phosphatase-like PHP family hydrolase
MKIEISTSFETSHTENYRTKITARIVEDDGVVLALGEDTDNWPDATKRRASAQEATRRAVAALEHKLKTAIDVAKKSGLL